MTEQQVEIEEALISYTNGSSHGMDGIERIEYHENFVAVTTGIKRVVAPWSSVQEVVVYYAESDGDELKDDGELGSYAANEIQDYLTSNGGGVAKGVSINRPVLAGDDECQQDMVLLDDNGNAIRVISHKDAADEIARRNG